MLAAPELVLTIIRGDLIINRREFKSEILELKQKTVFYFYLNGTHGKQHENFGMFPLEQSHDTPWRNPPSMARPLSNWSLWLCRVLQQMFGPLAAWRSKCAPWLARSLPMIRSHILQFLWTNIEFAGKSSSIFGHTQNGSIHRLFSSWLSWLVEPKAFSRTFCCWATRRSNPPKARKLRPQSDLNMVSAKWLERGNPWEASLINSLFQVNCHIGWFFGLRSCISGNLDEARSLATGSSLLYKPPQE